jgi:hypothetical protein
LVAAIVSFLSAQNTSKRELDSLDFARPGDGGAFGLFAQAL